MALVYHSFLGFVGRRGPSVLLSYTSVSIFRLLRFFFGRHRFVVIHKGWDLHAGPIIGVLGSYLHRYRPVVNKYSTPSFVRRGRAILDNVRGDVSHFGRLSRRYALTKGGIVNNSSSHGCLIGGQRRNFEDECVTTSLNWGHDRNSLPRVHAFAKRVQPYGRRRFPIHVRVAIVQRVFLYIRRFFGS